MSHQHATLEDTVYFHFGANDTSGSGADGASPVYDVRLAGAAADAAPVLSGSATLLSHANYPAGAHEIAIAATDTNGFAGGNTYAVFCALAVDGQNPTGFVGSFTLDQNTIRPNTWYVCKGGNDSSAGTSWGAALLTISQAVTNASAGDRIEIGPGTYSEQVDSSTKAGITFHGAGAGATIVSTAAGHGMQVGNYTTVERMTSDVSTGAGTDYAIELTAKTGVTLRDSEFIGRYSAVYGSQSVGLLVERCRLVSIYDGLLVSGLGAHFRLLDSTVETDGSIGVAPCACVRLNNASGVIAKCTLRAIQTIADAGDMLGINASGMTENVVVSNTTITAEHQHASATGDAIGVSFTGTAATSGIVLSGCIIKSLNAGSGDVYDLVRATAGTLQVDGTMYDKAKTNGTITDVLDDLPTAAAIADAVWDEAYAGHATPGTYGILVGAAFEEV